jgi:hypothetical protein
MGFFLEGLLVRLLSGGLASNEKCMDPCLCKNTLKAQGGKRNAKQYAFRKKWRSGDNNLRTGKGGEYMKALRFELCAFSFHMGASC